MNSLFVKSLVLVAVVSTTGFVVTAKAPKAQKKLTAAKVMAAKLKEAKPMTAKVEQAPQSKFPTLSIKTIHNTTNYDMLFVDRLAKDKSILLPAGKVTQVGFVANSKHKVTINGSMTDIMAQKAQYVFKKLDQNKRPELNQEVYFNLCIVLGGVNDGSGIITGTPGSLAL